MIGSKLVQYALCAYSNSSFLDKCIIKLSNLPSYTRWEKTELSQAKWCNASPQWPGTLWTLRLKTLNLSTRHPSLLMPSQCSWITDNVSVLRERWKKWLCVCFYPSSSSLFFLVYEHLYLAQVDRSPYTPHPVLQPLRSLATRYRHPKRRVEKHVSSDKP